MSTATRLRRRDEAREIIVFERGPYVSYANCGLPYYVGGIIEDRSSLLLQTPESLRARFALDVHTGHEVTAIDAGAATVHVRDLATGETSSVAYDTLVLAGGSRATRTPSDGTVPTVTLRTIDDVDTITDLLSTAGERPRAVVVGAGFIGLEAVENLIHRNALVTLIQHSGQVLSPLDPEMAAPVASRLESAGVVVRMNTRVQTIADGRVVLSDGDTVAADLVIDASGVHPDTALALSAGVALGATGGIAVDAQQRTSVPLIYAVGDGTEKIDHVSGQPTLVTMAGLANRHGRAVADAIAGHHPQDAVAALGTAIVAVLGLSIAMVGWNEKRLRTAGRAHRVIHLHPSSHAGYYPGAEQMAMKILIDPDDDTILGAQIVGGNGVDKRIDIIATAIAGGITASGLAHLELAYAPQYGSAKDPINMAGYIAENTRGGLTPTIQWHELEAARTAGATIVDVRSPSEYANGAIPGAWNISLDDLRGRHAELPDTPLIVHCQVGQRGHTATRLLQQLGHSVRNLDGGFLTWSAGAGQSLPARTTPRPHPVIEPED